VAGRTRSRAARRSAALLARLVSRSGLRSIPAPTARFGCSSLTSVRTPPSNTPLPRIPASQLLLHLCLDGQTSSTPVLMLYYNIRLLGLFCRHNGLVVRAPALAEPVPVKQQKGPRGFPAALCMSIKVRNQSRRGRRPPPPPPPSRRGGRLSNTSSGSPSARGISAPVVWSTIFIDNLVLPRSSKPTSFTNTS